MLQRLDLQVWRPQPGNSPLDHFPHPSCATYRCSSPIAWTKWDDKHTQLAFFHVSTGDKTWPRSPFLLRKSGLTTSIICTPLRSPCHFLTLHRGDWTMFRVCTYFGRPHDMSRPGWLTGRRLCCLQARPCSRPVSVPIFVVWPLRGMIRHTYKPCLTRARPPLSNLSRCLSENPASKCLTGRR